MSPPPIRNDLGAPLALPVDAEDGNTIGAVVAVVVVMVVVEEEEEFEAGAAIATADPVAT